MTKEHKFLGLNITPLTSRRLANFRANRRGFYSLWIFSSLLFITIFANFIANDSPIMVKYKGGYHFPVFFSYSEKTFGGEFETKADFKDDYIIEQIEKNGWIIWPPIRYSFDTVIYDLPIPAPSPPSTENILGTDDQARDVFARVLYGLRISILFGLVLTFFSSIIGVTAGAIQGYFGGGIDLFLQRFIEVWGSLPRLFILIIVSSMLVPGLWTLLFILLAFQWMSLTGMVRAEFLRARNFDYIRAARALGVSNFWIIKRHMLPNAMVATFTFLPFILSGSIISLTALDFLGLGLPAGSPSLGELLAQGKGNLQAPWLGITAFATLATILILLVFIGEAVRDAFDPKKTR